jgi:hypothetical protein
MNDNTLGAALTKCFFCGEDDAIVINRHLSKHEAKKVNEMHGMVIDMTPCSKCKELMSQGIILMTFNPALSDTDWNKEPIPNPYRTGGFFVVRDEACQRFMPPELYDWAKKSRWMFIEDEVAGVLGLTDRA